MSELPSMTVFEVLSLLEACYERQFAHFLDACALSCCTTAQLMCYSTLFNGLISV